MINYQALEELQIAYSRSEEYVEHDFLKLGVKRCKRGFLVVGYDRKQGQVIVVVGQQTILIFLIHDIQALVVGLKKGDNSSRLSALC